MTLVFFFSFSLVPSSSSFLVLQMFTQDKVTTFDFTGERAPYRMSYHTGSEQVRVVVCVCVFGL